jgi:hypothetical protein
MGRGAFRHIRLCIQFHSLAAAVSNPIRVSMFRVSLSLVNQATNSLKSLASLGSLASLLAAVVLDAASFDRLCEHASTGLVSGIENLFRKCTEMEEEIEESEGDAQFQSLATQKDRVLGTHGSASARHVSSMISIVAINRYRSISGSEYICCHCIWIAFLMSHLCYHEPSKWCRQHLLGDGEHCIQGSACLTGARFSPQGKGTIASALAKAAVLKVTSVRII